MAEGLRYVRTALVRVVDHNGDEKCLALIHVERAIDCQTPLAPEVTFIARLGVGGNDSDKQPAVLDLRADLAVPRISATQGVLVEPDFDPGGSQCLSNAGSSLGILGCVAEKYRVGSP